MKRIKKLSIKVLAIILLAAVFIPSQAGTGEKNGGIYYYQGMDEAGVWANYSYSTCDPCGLIGKIFSCHCQEAVGKYPIN